MEEIRWVITPKCPLRVPEPSFARRYPCMGCEKLREKIRPAKSCPAQAVHTLRPEKRLARNGEILRLRAQGLSYGGIAGRLGLPRSTVQSVIARGC